MLFSVKKSFFTWEVADMKINEQIKKLRKQRNFNQYELSEIIGVSVDTVRRWEKGSQVPRADELIHLASALSVTVSELLNGPDNGKIKITLSYDWTRYEKGEVDMNGNLFELFMGTEGQLGLKGAGLPKTREELKELKDRLCADLDNMFELQLQRGAIQTA